MKKLEQIICDLQPIDIKIYENKNYLRYTIVQPCGKEFDVGQLRYCTLDKYLVCRGKYERRTKTR